MFRNRLSGFAASIPPVTKNLIIINFIIWVVEAVFPRFSETIVNVLGLHFVSASGFNPIQIVTYLFVHSPSTPFHVFFNMFTLWMFGSLLERIWGSKRFFVFYFICGIGAAIVQDAVWAATWMNDYVDSIAKMNGITTAHMREVVDAAIANGNADFLSAIGQYKNSMVTIGASGAVFGIILGFAFVFPDRPLYLFFIPVPIKAKYMMIGYGVIEFFLGVAGTDMVAHFAHLGGMIFGLAILLYWKKKGTLRGGSFY